MITINLLPEELRPIQRTPLPHILSLLVLAAALFFMGKTYLSMTMQLNSVEHQIKTAQVELKALESTVKEYEMLLKQKDLLQKKIGAIQTILSDRTIWSEHLHQLAVLTPENIWYKRIRITTRRFTEEQPAIDPRTGLIEIDQRTGKQKMARVSVDRPILEISGYAIDDETGMSSTANLATKTAEDEAFSSLFTLYTSKITDTDFDGYPAREFTFEYLITG